MLLFPSPTFFPSAQHHQHIIILVDTLHLCNNAVLEQTQCRNKRSTGANAVPEQTQCRSKRSAGANAVPEQTQCRSKRSAGPYAVLDQTVRDQTQCRTKQPARPNNLRSQRRVGPMIWFI